MKSPQHILVAPLDWGLGHATRCIPIIHQLMSRGCKVSIAGNGASLQLLRNEFPHLTFFQLPSYQVHYGHHGSLIFSLFTQLPNFIRAMRKEHQVLKRIITEQHIDRVISDNRYGCWSKKVKSVLITHQLSIQMPASLRWVGGIVNYFNRRQIQKFDSCWIPDDPSYSLAGALTESNIAKKFIGFLSRFSKANYFEKKYRVLAIVSGPEPERSVFEQLVLKQLQSLDVPSAMVCGLPAENPQKQEAHGVKLYNHVPSEKMQELIQRSEVIVCQSGYSTLMDLIALKKDKIILVPTPGQTEQEYLAKSLADRKLAVWQARKDFTLVQAITNTSALHGFASWNTTSNLLSQTLDEWLNT